ncbi:MAG: alcohol dehydrogenase catalytic domain-containing protein [Verrucomicrobia bacterium]|nr:alcohol dehydrogenase catalytic domain-containing protein [Leptolyngbya sp. ES-bin-22]
MKAIALQNGFGIDHLESIEVPTPQPVADEVLVKVQAVSLNYVDLMVVTGKMNPNLLLPFVPGADGAGTVERVGTDVTAFKPGDAVVTTFSGELS